MAVLLLRLAGPMQSWGTQSRFSHRDTDLEPSKSGVIGLLCSAMGKPRDDTEYIKKLAGLKMGVRIDRQGTKKEDYHTAGGTHLKDETYGVISSDRKSLKTVISRREYLADAVFLVALKGDVDMLKKIDETLQNPVWQVYLGRKAFIPGMSVFLKDGLLPDCDDLAAALKDYPYLIPHRKDKPEKLRLEIETDFGQGDRVKQDQPISFISANRRFGLRSLDTTKWVHTADLPPVKEESCIYLS